MSQSRRVVAVVLTWHGKVGLFKRSRVMRSDPGKWHCITGFIDDPEVPIGAAVRELFEETGLGVAELVSFVEGDPLRLPDDEGNLWAVHTFHASTEQRRLRLNWEHESFRWVPPSRLGRFEGRVEWLDDVLRCLDLAARRASATLPPALTALTP